ncbi:MAG: lipopolysaccharide kinase InaA family protein, partial [Myxococcota bacterium]
MQSESRLSPAALQAILSAHREALKGRGTVLRRSRHGAVTRVDFDGESLCVKQYGDTGSRRRLKDLIRRPRAERAWRAARRLRDLGLATPEALALVEDGGARYLVMRFLPDGLPLDRLLQERLVGGSSSEGRAARRRMLRDLGRWLRGIHDAGVYHDDWSAKNILAAERDGCWSFFLLDLESVVPHKGLNRRRRMKNLGQICDAPA